MSKYNLSVIITNYNYGVFLPQCIDSILNQTYQPCEIIIADDASTDNSVDIIKDYEIKHPRIRGIFNKTNLKLSKNKHNAILLSKGNYITFIDSDDYYVSNYKLENEMELIKKYKEEKNKEIIAFSKNIQVDVQGNKITDTLKQRIVQGKIYFNLLAFSFKNYKPRDFILSKSAYLSVEGFDFGSKLYVDDCLKLKLATKYEFYFCGEVGIAYRQHEKGMHNEPRFFHYKWQKYSFKKSLVLLHSPNKEFAYIIFYYHLIKRMIRHSILYILKKNDKIYQLFIRLIVPYFK